MTYLLRRAGATLAALASVITTGAALAAEPRCQGKDMLAELGASDPALIAKVTAEASRVPNAGALLWRIERRGLEPSHLFGTVHMTDERVTTLSPATVSALDASRRVALEVADMSPGALSGAIGKVAPLLLNLAGPGLAASLEPHEYQKVRQALTKTGLPEQLISAVRPWLVYMLLSLSDCERRRAAAGIQVLDQRLAAEAKRRGIEPVGLETMESQLKAMAAVPDARQLEMLRVSLKLIDRIDDMMETMVLLYTRRQMGLAWPFNLAIAEKHGIPRASYAEFESEIIVKRNKLMLEKAMPLIDQGAAFVAVGALHLVGEHGLVALLRENGYRVTAVE
jgi:hypothetical protein